MKHSQIPAEILVFLGGGIGASLRFLAGIIIPETSFPQTTLTINLAGALCLGFLTRALACLATENLLHRALRLGVGTGIMGGFTTYSTFAIGSVQLLQNNQIETALIYLLFSLLGGIFCCWLGITLAEKIYTGQKR